jgi:hypothetical protein
MKQTCKKKYLHIKNHNTTNIPRKTLYIEIYDKHTPGNGKI